MMRSVLLLVLMMVFCVRVDAQETSNYHLHVPSLEEYLTAVPEIMAFNEPEYLFGIRRGDTYLTLALYHELMWRYPEFSQARFDLLYQTALAFRDLYSQPISMFDDERTQADWNILLIQAWWREHPTAFEAVDFLQFGSFDIAVTRVDLNGDNIDEVVLDIRETRSGIYGAYLNYVDNWVLQLTAEGYRRVPSPLNWYHDTWYRGSDGRSGIVHTLRMEDINDNGLIEWVVLEGSYILRGHGECRRMRVLGWRGDALVDLINGELHYCTENTSMLAEAAPEVKFTFTATEIQQTQQRFDSWGCFWEQTTVFEWDGMRYTERQQRQDFEETFNCALRQAEEAMRSGDFENAATAYERALILPDTQQEIRTDDELLELNREQRQYARLRLALAYALIGRVEDALPLVDALRSAAPASPLMERWISSLDQVETAVEMCLAVHDTLTALRDENNIWPRWNSYTAMYIAERFEDVVVWLENYPADPSLAGCDPHQVPEVPIDPEEDAVETANEVPVIATDGINPPHVTDRASFHCGPIGTWFCGLYEPDAGRALEMIEALTNEDFERDSHLGNLPFAVQYRRALALESLGRTDEALAEYIAVYETAPESAWGMLASLHLEVVDNAGE